MSRPDMKRPPTPNPVAEVMFEVSPQFVNAETVPLTSECASASTAVWEGPQDQTGGRWTFFDGCSRSSHDQDYILSRSARGIHNPGNPKPTGNEISMLSYMGLLSIVQRLISFETLNFDTAESRPPPTFGPGPDKQPCRQRSLYV